MPPQPLSFIPYFSPVLDRQIFSPERSISPELQRRLIGAQASSRQALEKDYVEGEPSETRR